MKRAKRYFGIFVAVIAALIFLTVFKTEATGYTIVNTSKGAMSLYGIMIAVLALAALVLISLIAFRPIKNDYLDKHSREEMKELRRLRDYIDSRKAEGYSEMEIRGALVDYRWDDDMVDYVLGDSAPRD